MPGRKDRPRRQIDDKAIVSVGDGEIITEAVSVAGSAVHLPQSIDTLVLINQAVFRSAATPLILVNIGWQHPDGEIPQDYIVQLAEDEDFTINPEKFVAHGLTAALYLKPATDYWIRVAPRIQSIQTNWSNILEVTTIADTVVPADVDNVTAEFTNSNLIITWDQPNDEAYKNARIRIWNAARTVLYDIYYQREAPFVLTAAENRRITNLAADDPLTNASIDVTSNSWGNVFGASVEIVSAVAPIPDTPTGITHSWESDDGTADEDVTIEWNDSTNADHYVLTLDSRDIITRTPFVVYPYLNNVRDHTPLLLSGDYNLSYSIIARDLLDQSSSPATGTLLNAAPPNTFGTVEVLPGFTNLGVIVTPSENILDFSHYAYALYDPTNTLVTSFTSSDPIQTMAVTTSGLYDVSVRAVDKFNQESDAIIINDTFIDALTIDELRTETEYSDSVSTSPATLDGLKNGDLTTNVVTYASGVSFRWTQAVRPQIDRYKPITLSISGTDVFLYFALSSDGITWRWFGGPLAATGSTGQNTTLVEYVDEGSTNAFSKSTGVYRFDLPVLIEARYVRIYHRDTDGTYSFREFYPRRMVQSDDVVAEDIKGINIAAAAINAGHISVTTLGAIQTSTGTLTINTGGYLRGGMTAFATGTGFYMGLDSGNPRFMIGSSSSTFLAYDGTNIVIQGGNLTIQTAGSAQRVVLDSSGISGYNSSSVLQVRMRSSDGAISAGSGDVLLNSDGIILNANNTATYNRPKAVKWHDSVNSEDVGSIRGWYNSTLHNLYLEAYTNNSSTKNGKIVIQANGTGPEAIITLLGDSTESSIVIDAGVVNVTGGLTVGFATSPALGEIKTSSDIISGTSTVAGATLPGIRSARAVDNYLSISDSTRTFIAGVASSAGGLMGTLTNHALSIRTNNTDRMNFSAGGAIGVFGSAGTTKQTVTGSRGGNAALASLLTILANHGWIVNSSS